MKLQWNEQREKMYGDLYARRSNIAHNILYYLHFLKRKITYLCVLFITKWSYILELKEYIARVAWTWIITWICRKMDSRCTGDMSQNIANCKTVRYNVNYINHLQRWNNSSYLSAWWTKLLNFGLSPYP